MVDIDNISLWTWDARPFPAFPIYQDIWSDGDNWIKGHWLTARIGACSLDDLVAEILSDYSFFKFDVKDLSGWVNGFIIPNQATARQVLEPLLGLFGSTATSQNGKIKFLPAASNPVAELNPVDFVESEELPIVTTTRAQVTELPAEAIVYHDEIRIKIESIASKSTRLDTQSLRQVQMQLPAVLPAELAQNLADSRIRDAWIGREGMQISLPAQSLQYTPGDTITINDERYNGLWQIQSIEDGNERLFDLKKVERPMEMSYPSSLPARAQLPPSGFGQPLALLLDIPRPLSSAASSRNLLTAVTANPWAGNYAFASSPDTSGFELRKSSNKRATIAKLTSSLSPGPQSRWDNANIIQIAPINGEFPAKTSLAVLNGSNALAVQSDDGNWEIIQYQNAVLENDGTISLSGLLRAQLGTEMPMSHGSSAGNFLVLLDQQVETIELGELEKNLPQNWRIGPGADAISQSSYLQQSFTFTDKASKPFSPVHIKAHRLANNDLTITWKRRSRIYGDDWDAVEIPLDEVTEGYRITVFNGQNVIREFDVTTTNAVYAASDQIADFTTLPQYLSLTVGQLDAFRM
ncbi:MAG: phage tail protein [Rhizobiaceae bacterium]|nr:phage tail protein [Rhizobiaceae bacterium]